MTDPLNTTTSAAPWRPDLHVFAASDVVPDALIVTDTLNVGAIEGDQPVIEVAYAVDDDADFVPEGEPIGEAEPQLASATIYTAKFAQLVRLTNEQYRQGQTPAELARSVSRALMKKADLALIAQPAPVGPDTAPVAGLLHTDDVTTEVVTDDSLDGLIDLEARVRAAGAEPTTWVMAPATWAEIRKFKTAAASNQNILGAGTEQSAPLLLGIPVKVNAAVPAGQGLLIDRNAVYSAVGPVHVATDSSAYFASDSVGIRATWRTGHALPRPDRIGRFSIGPIGS